jgi:hypothetical protein
VIPSDRSTRAASHRCPVVKAPRFPDLQITDVVSTDSLLSPYTSVGGERACRRARSASGGSFETRFTLGSVISVQPERGAARKTMPRPTARPRNVCTRARRRRSENVRVVVEWRRGSKPSARAPSGVPAWMSGNHWATHRNGSLRRLAVGARQALSPAVDGHR